MCISSHMRSTSCKLRSRFSFGIADFTARINRFFGECAKSTNSRICVLYPRYVSILARIASVASAAIRSLMMPYSIIGASNSLSICPFTSCWQHGTDKIYFAFHCTTHNQSPYRTHAVSQPCQPAFSSYSR